VLGLDAGDETIVLPRIEYTDTRGGWQFINDYQKNNTIAAINADASINPATVQFHLPNPGSTNGNKNGKDSKDTKKTERWSDEKCKGLATQIAQLKSAVGQNTRTINDVLSNNPGASSYVMGALTSTKLANSVYKLGMASAEFGEFVQSSRFAVGIQGVSSGIGAFGLVANFYGLTRGIEHHDTGQIVSNAAGISLWGVMAVGGSEGSAVITAANPWVAGTAVGTFVALKGYEYYEDKQIDKAVAQTVLQNTDYLNRNVDSLSNNEGLYSQHCK
jgi:hypothetical protein